MPAHAATPPALVSPDGSASFSEGGAITFTWTGELQGDPDTLDRSYFRVELSPAEDVPADQQASWTSLSNYTPTPSGEAATTAQLGVPSVGSYRWRVCAYGVENDQVSNTIAQLPGGCSPSRAIVSVASTEANPASSELKVTSRRTVQEPNTYVTRTTPAEPGVQRTIDKVRYIEGGANDEARFDKQKDADRAEQLGRGGASALSGIGGGKFGEEGQAIGASATGGAFGGVGHALSLAIPGTPIPYWSLLLLLASLPLVWLWNRSTLAMFEWPAGSDGELAELGNLDSAFKGSDVDADGDDDSPHHTDSASRGTLAA